jgi:hypothetical protein
MGRKRFPTWRNHFGGGWGVEAGEQHRAAGARKRRTGQTSEKNNPRAPKAREFFFGIPMCIFHVFYFKKKQRPFEVRDLE